MKPRVNRKLTPAKILSPRWSCWRCHGRRLVKVMGADGNETIKACPSCNGTDPNPAALARPGSDEECGAGYAMRRAA